MSSVIDAIFRPDSAKQQGPSKEEVAAQKEQEAILKRQQQIATDEAAARNKTITARSAGPQTLFTTGAQIPQKLSGAL